MPETSTTPQQQVAACLPESIRWAVDNYRNFAGTSPPVDSKDFTAFQSGCKAALAHLEALLKVTEQVQRSQPEDHRDTAPERAVLNDLVREARTAVARLKSDS